MGSFSASFAAFWARWRATFLRLSTVPVAFLGVGVYRAWLATFFRFGAFPGVTLADYALFEMSIGAVSFVAALLARRIAPLWSNRTCMAVTGVATVTGSLLVVAACFAPGALGCAPQAMPFCALKEVGLALAGGGLGLLILVWCEFYGALNPMRVAVYHALSIFAGEVLCWLFMGLDAAFIAVFSCVLPLVSLGWAHRAIAGLPAAERPHPGEIIARSAIPAKPICLMAICTFAMQFATMPGQPMAAGNVLGTMVACAFVVLGVLSTSRWFNFDAIYRVAFPLVCASSLLAVPLLSAWPQATTFAYDAGYTMMSMFIMIVLANITYRFGINAVWLNGLERGIRYMVETLGWGAHLAVAGSLTEGAGDVAHLAVAAVVFVAFLSIALSEKSLGARWGIDLHEAEGEGGQPKMPEQPGTLAAPRPDPFSPGRLALRVSDLAREYGLTDREEEVLQLVARKVPVAQMEENLFVARGTIKAHTGRIYRKLGVHSRAELFDLLGVSDDEPGPAGSPAGE